MRIDPGFVRGRTAGVAWRAIVVAAAAAGIGGCVQGPDWRPPRTDVPATWSGAAAASSASTTASSPAPASRTTTAAFDGRRWWRVFRDPALDALVEDAVRQNLDLQTAALRIAEARAQREAALAKERPSIAGSGIAGRQRSSENGLLSSMAGGASGGSGGNGGSGGSTGASTAPSPYSDLFQVGFDATWELDLWGQLRRDAEAAQAEVLSAEEARGDAAVSLTAEVARTYFTLRGVQRQRAIAQADLADQQRLLQLTSSRSRAGFATQADVVQQQVELARAEATLPAIDQQLDATLHQLALLLALPPGALDARLAGPPPDGVPLPPEVPVGLPGDLLQRRPDVRRAEAELHAATARVGVARAQLFPSITLGGSAGLQATHANDLFDWASRFWLGGAQVSIPIFEGGRLEAQVRVSDARQREAALAWRQAVLRAVHEADQAMSAYALAQRETAALANELALARRSRDLMASRWRGGFVSQLEVIETDRRAHEVELSASRSSVDATQALVALFKALGGDWRSGGEVLPPAADVAASVPAR